MSVHVLACSKYPNNLGTQDIYLSARVFSNFVPLILGNKYLNYNFFNDY